MESWPQWKNLRSLNYKKPFVNIENRIINQIIMSKPQSKYAKFPSIFTLSIAVVLVLGLVAAVVHRVNVERVFELEERILINSVDSDIHAGSVARLFANFMKQPKQQPTMAEVVSVINALHTSLKIQIQQTATKQSSEDIMHFHAALTTLEQLNTKLLTQDSNLKVPLEVSQQTVEEINQAVQNSIEIIRNARHAEIQNLIVQSHDTVEKGHQYVMALVMLIIIITSIGLFFNKSWYLTKLTRKSRQNSYSRQKERDYHALIDAQQQGVLVVVKDQIVFVNQFLRLLLNLSTDDAEVEVTSLFSESEAVKFNEQIQNKTTNQEASKKKNLNENSKYTNSNIDINSYLYSSNIVL